MKNERAAGLTLGAQAAYRTTLMPTGKKGKGEEYCRELIRGRDCKPSDPVVAVWSDGCEWIVPNICCQDLFPQVQSKKGKKGDATYLWESKDTAVRAAIQRCWHNPTEAYHLKLWSWDPARYQVCQVTKDDESALAFLKSWGEKFARGQATKDDIEKAKRDNAFC